MLTTVMWLLHLTAQSMPTIAAATPNADFVPEKEAYYRARVVPRLYPFSPPLLAAVVLLAGFICWRVMRRCCRCCCHWCCVVPTRVRICKSVKIMSSGT